VILYGIIVVIIILTLVSYAVVQETRAQLHWRSLVANGDLDAIRELVETEVERWHGERVPKGIPALLWHGIQTVELTDVSASGARMNCSAEGEYSLVDGRRMETSSPLAEAMKVTQKLADMLLYDIPNIRLEFVQIDAYTAFRDENGHAQARCILSSIVRRREIENLDWETTSANEFVELVGGRFVADASGGVSEVEPFAWAGEAA